MKFYIYTLGCKLNIYESEAISYILEKNGFKHTTNISEANYFIVNTCSVTTKASAKSRNIIRGIKNKNKDAIVIVCGCLVQTEEEILREIPEIDILIDNKNKINIIDAINKFNYFKNSKDKFYYKTEIDHSFDYELGELKNHSRAFIKIQDGCDNFCSYCQIPLARGNSRSRKYEDIINEITKIKENGYKEVVFTGVNIGNYNYNEINFSKLLDYVTDKFKDIRFRISSIEIQNIDSLFYEIIKKDNLCPHFHIPLQSGSDKILKLMNRKYTTTNYFEVVTKLRDIKKNPFIATDLIIGFPDESEEDFLETYDFIKKVDFSFIHVFGFSPRKGTKAFDMKPKIPERIRDLRIEKIIKLRDEMNLKYRKSFLNKCLPVIVEKKLSPTLFSSKADNYLDILIRSDKILKSKELYSIQLIEIDKDKNYGILI
ncbi:MAG TPA: tRNA (N(6)-L-threonylcarbamoyladenosine(37)-C(2))-methylthiotransferase MtaB [Spirochaetota bacterium]|nr:tRNA (N(6)-L-threonylcarbamoyladenosine(37)-C(2))-methylthiotransferase MtaB [Spirochaetota bacterium]HOL57251.1 tRNA (N(6)-L-threonylcarbamoyladenosine(37)-C(2))-methylthiotransferase MtaB [Spirochaetota bacterium]HPP03515.1 tRNA (N(6)-L-threonylcarbamoyladenosine(37)-C(2))-methylthiotransferase MtaB [Spirochaetota bacterium]